MIPRANSAWSLEQAAHLLNRAGFGGSPSDVQVVFDAGREQAVEKLLNPAENIDATAMPTWVDKAEHEKEARAFFQENIGFRKAKQSGDLAAMKPFQERQKMQQNLFRRRGVEAQGWWFRKILHTQAPLREKMTLFFHDHFSTSIQKVRQPTLIMWQNQTLRESALGNYKQLVHKIVRDPAMMLYLDTQNSKKTKPNENFAREVMELFTLGEGNYTEQDVKEAARAFTGYNFNRITGDVRHAKKQWDEGVKTIFGKTGNYDGDAVVELIFQKPRAAEHLIEKLWAWFVSDEPIAKDTLQALAQTFREKDYELTPLLREIFLSAEFYDAKNIRSQIKSPIQFLVQMLRQFELEQAPHAYTLIAQQQLGQVLFMPPNVAGWDWGKAWINTNTLLTRYNVAGFISKGAKKADMEIADAPDDMKMQDASNKKISQALKKNSPENTAMLMQKAELQWQGPDYEKIAPRSLRSDHARLISHLSFRFFNAPVREHLTKKFLAFADEKQGVVFTNHEVAELVHLMLSTPDYQLV